VNSYNIFLIVIGNFMMAICGILPQEQSKRFYCRSNFWAMLFGAIIILVGSINSHISQSRIESQLLEKTSKVETLSKELSQLSNESIAIITGGDNYPYVDVALYEEDKPQLIVNNTGEYPLYDINFRFFDIDKYNHIKQGKKAWDSLMDCSVIVEFGNLSPGFSRTISFRPVLSWPNDRERNVNVFITARNGYFVEKLRFRRIENKWVRALIVKKGDKELIRKIDEQYPLNDQGEVDWGD